jgi:DNA-binding response OmpR family regulator
LSEITQFQFINPLPIILCSTLDARRRGFENGANIYLVKPVLPTVLIETLHQLTYHSPDKKKEA